MRARTTQPQYGKGRRAFVLPSSVLPRGQPVRIVSPGVLGARQGVSSVPARDQPDPECNREGWKRGALEFFSHVQGQKDKEEYDNLRRYRLNTDMEWLTKAAARARIRDRTSSSLAKADEDDCGSGGEWHDIWDPDNTDPPQQLQRHVENKVFTGATPTSTTLAASHMHSSLPTLAELPFAKPAFRAAQRAVSMGQVCATIPRAQPLQARSLSRSVAQPPPSVQLALNTTGAAKPFAQAPRAQSARAQSPRATMVAQPPPSVRLMLNGTGAVKPLAQSPRAQSPQVITKGTVTMETKPAALRLAASTPQKTRAYQVVMQSAGQALQTKMASVDSSSRSSQHQRMQRQALSSPSSNLLQNLLGSTVKGGTLAGGSLQVRSGTGQRTLSYQQTPRGR